MSLQEGAYSCNACFIKSHPLFRYLKDEEILSISIIKKIEYFTKGAIIYCEGDRMHGFYCIRKGIVKIYKTGSDGREQIIRFAKPGDIIGYRSVVSNEPACTTTSATTDVVACQIPSNTLFNLIKRNGDFALQLMTITCRELGEANAYLTDIAQKSVRERLAEILLHLKEEFGEDPDGMLNIRLTREEISNIVGTATESVIRLLSEFKADGLIQLQGRKIKILDYPGLRKTAN